MSIALVISGLILLIGSIVLYYLNFKKKFYDYKNTFTLQYLKENYLALLIPFMLFFASLILLAIGYYTSNDAKDNLVVTGLTYNTTNIILVFVFIVLFSITFYIFLTTMFFLLYIYDNKEKSKTKLIIKIVMFFSLILSIITLFMAFEFGANYIIYPIANRIIFSKEGVHLLNRDSDKYKELMNNLGSSFKFEIALYALFIISGAVLVLYICDYKLYRIYGHHGLINTCFFIAFPSGILGARAWFCIGEWEKFASNPIRIFYIWEGGLAIMGGAVFGIIAGILVMIILKIKNERYKPIDYLLLVDIIVPTILVAQAIGRWGNFFNNEVHGNPVDFKYFMWIPTFVRNNMRFSDVTSTLDENQIYVPLFFIESLVNLFGYFFIEYGVKNLFGINHKLNHDYHPGGSLVGWYIMWYGATRAVLEPLRHPAYNMGADGTFSTISSYWMMGIGSFIIVVCVVLKILNEKGIIVYQWQKYNLKKEEKNV